MVKDFYWAMRAGGEEIKPESAATQCDILPAIIETWFDDPDIKEWFFTSPIKFKQAMRATTMMAIRKGRELLESHDPSVREKAMRYFIDQQVGKAQDKGRDEDGEEDDAGLAKAIEDLNKLETEWEVRHDDKNRISGGEGPEDPKKPKTTGDKHREEHVHGSKPSEKMGRVEVFHGDAGVLAGKSRRAEIRSEKTKD